MLLSTVEVGTGLLLLFFLLQIADVDDTLKTSVLAKIPRHPLGLRARCVLSCCSIDESVDRRREACWFAYGHSRILVHKF